MFIKKLLILKYILCFHKNLPRLGNDNCPEVNYYHQLR